LIRGNYIHLDRGRYHAKEKDFFLPESVSKKHIPELLRYTFVKGKWVDKTIFQNWSESISPEAYAKIYDIIVEANQKIGGVLSGPNSIGEIPFFYTCLLDTMNVGQRDSSTVSEREASEIGRPLTGDGPEKDGPHPVQ
jgi:hypothetical protein